MHWVERRRTYVQVRPLGHHALDADAHALDDGEQAAADDGAVARRLQAAAHGQRAAGEEACYDWKERKEGGAKELALWT